jgi:hypothetical protein
VAAPPRTVPSPFERDRARKAGPPEAQASSGTATAAATATAPADAPPGDARALLHAWLMEQGSAHIADAVQHARIAVNGGEIQVAAPDLYQMYFEDRGFERALRAVFGKPLRLRFTAGNVEAGAPASAARPASSSREDEAAARADANPEVQRFREVFGGEIRKVRNLKE